MATRIQPLDPQTTTGPSREIFDAVKGKIGMVPNLYRVLGHSPAALSAYLGLNDQLAASSLAAPVREKIALAVSQANGCGYCLSAHTLIGAKMLGVPEEELTRARDGKGNDDHETALLALAVKIVEGRGRITDADLQSARSTGVTEPELVEVVASIAALTFSNYMNHIARTPIDFPAVIDLPAAA